MARPIAVSSADPAGISSVWPFAQLAVTGHASVLDGGQVAVVITRLVIVPPQGPDPELGRARPALAGFALGSLTYLSDSLALVLAGTVADGAGLLWLVAVTGAAIQRYTPPRLQGRATAAWTMAVITPQTVSIAAGTAVISYLSYRVLLLAVIGVVGASAEIGRAHV